MYTVCIQGRSSILLGLKVSFSVSMLPFPHVHNFLQCSCDLSVIYYSLTLSCFCVMPQWLHRVAPQYLNSFTSSISASHKMSWSLSVVHTSVPLSETLPCTYSLVHFFCALYKTSTISWNLITPFQQSLCQGVLHVTNVTLAHIHISCCLSSHSCSYLCLSWMIQVVSQPLPRPHANLKTCWFLIKLN